LTLPNELAIGGHPTCARPGLAASRGGAHFRRPSLAGRVAHARS
jgi:hypothetical protein